jgi:hypothetical protein
VEPYLLPVFILSWLLIICDAALGYHLAPLLLRAGQGDDSLSVRGIRSLLSLTVALYMFCACFAFFRHRPYMLLVVTGIVVLDIAAQLVVRRSYGGR